MATKEFVPWPIEIRFCEPNNSTNQTKSPPRLACCTVFHNLIFAWSWHMLLVQSQHMGTQFYCVFPNRFNNWLLLLDKMEFCCSLRYWFRAKGKLSDDQALHRYATFFNSQYISVFLLISGMMIFVIAETFWPLRLRYFPICIFTQSYCFFSFQPFPKCSNLASDIKFSVDYMKLYDWITYAINTHNEFMILWLMVHFPYLRWSFFHF